VSFLSLCQIDCEITSLEFEVQKIYFYYVIQERLSILRIERTDLVVDFLFCLFIIHISETLSYNLVFSVITLILLPKRLHIH